MHENRHPAALSAKEQQLKADAMAGDAAAMAELCKRANTKPPPWCEPHKQAMAQ